MIQRLKCGHCLLYTSVIDVPGYERITLADDTRFIATMNYNYAGTRELNEALASRFVVIRMPALTLEDLQRLLREQFPDLSSKYNKQFGLLFMDIQKKCESGELTSKAMDLRGLLDAISLMHKGIPVRDALDLGVTNKIFDSYEQALLLSLIHIYCEGSYQYRNLREIQLIEGWCQEWEREFKIH